MEGWIMLQRKSLESRVWASPKLWQLWCYCLLRANHKPAWVSITTGRGETTVHVEAGQFIYGRHKTAEALGAKPSTVHDHLIKLQTMGNINIRPNTHYSIVTIVNWDTYQGKKDDIRQPTDNQPTGKQQPTDTNNNDKNENNDDKYSPNSDELRLAEMLFNEIISRKPDFKKPNFQKWAVHIDRMIRLDSRASENIEKVIRWSQRNDFWQNNILSTEKLRKHFDKLELQMEGKKNERHSRTVRNSPDEKTYIR